MSYTTKGLRFSGHQSFTAGAPMTDDDLRRVAPSIFAEDKHSSRSERFAYIPTFELIDALRKEGFVPVRAIQGSSRVPGKEDFTKHMVRFAHPDYQGRKALVGTAPEAVLMNAHDGTSSYRVLSGVFRSICTNSMIVMDDNATDIKISHVGKVQDKVIDATFTVIGEAKQTLEKCEEWQGITLDHDECKILAEAAHVLRFGDGEGEVKTPIEANQLLRARRMEDRDNTLWLTHNRIQENVIKGGLRGWQINAETRERRRTTSREVKAIDGNTKLNQALWMLSARMAELKGAAV